MGKIQWNYHRAGCKTCGKTKAYLDRNQLEPSEIVDARKVRLGPAEALALVNQAHEVYATKGTRVVHIDLRSDRPTDEELTKLLIGPSGNLRAPTLVVGKTLIVGFDEAMYAKLLSSSAKKQPAKSQKD